MRSEWQNHKGKPFFYCNYANLEVDQLQAEMEAVRDFITQQPANSVSILADVRGLSASRQIVGHFLKSLPRTKKHLYKSAVIGIGLSGQKKVLFDAVMRITGAEMQVFEDIEKAKDWLAEG
jgi:hypothetical protein